MPSARRKGVEFERAIVRLFKRAGWGAERCFQFRNQTDNRPDLTAGKLWIECKSGRRLNVAAIWQETARRCRRWWLENDEDADGDVPAVVHKSSKTGPALITLSVPALLHLIDLAYAAGREEARRDG